MRCLASGALHDGRRSCPPVSHTGGMNLPANPSRTKPNASIHRFAHQDPPPSRYISYSFGYRRGHYLPAGVHCWQEIRIRERGTRCRDCQRLCGDGRDVGSCTGSFSKCAWRTTSRRSSTKDSETLRPHLVLWMCRLFPFSSASKSILIFPPTLTWPSDPQA